MSNELDTEAIEARLNAATPGPWEVDNRVRCMAVVSPSRVDLPGLGADYSGVVAFWSGPSSSGDPSGAWSDARRTKIEIDATFIAHAPEDLRALLAEVRRLTAIVADERDPDGVLNESIAACDILGIDRTGDYDYLATLRAVVKERDEARSLSRVMVESCREVQSLLDRAEGERDEARAALQHADRIHREQLAAVNGERDDHLQRELVYLRAQVIEARRMLAECTVLSGADCDGNTVENGWEHLWPDAVAEVRRLREDYNEVLVENRAVLDRVVKERSEARDERDRLRTALEYARQPVLVALEGDPDRLTCCECRRVEGPPFAEGDRCPTAMHPDHGTDVLQSARVEGARGMRQAILDRLGSLTYDVAALDPAAVVGSVPTTCPTCKGECPNPHPCKECDGHALSGDGFPCVTCQKPCECNPAASAVTRSDGCQQCNGRPEVLWGWVPQELIGSGS